MEKTAFDEHSIWGSVQEATENLARIEALGDIERSESLEELRQLLAFSASLGESDQLFLISSGSLDALAKAWNQVNQGLAQFLQAPESYGAHLETARSTAAEAVRVVLRQFPRPEEAGAKKASSTRAASAYVEQVDAARQLLADEVVRLRSERTAVAAKHEEEVRVLNESVQGLRDEIAKQTQRISDDETRLGSALTTTNDAFLKSQTERQEGFQKWLKEQEDSFEELAQPHVEAVISADEKAGQALSEIEALRTSVIDMSNLAAGDILGDEYRKSADADRRAGYIGYGVGVAAGVGGVLLVLFAFGDVRSALEWSQVALKLGLTAAVGGIAAVAFRFGAQSLSRATAFKRQELELRALTPFLQGVIGSDDAKLAFVKTAFGRAWTLEAKVDKTEPAASEDLVRLLQTSIETVGKAIR